MSFDKLFDKGPKTPDTPTVPTRQDPRVEAARLRAKRGVGSISRSTTLGGRSGGAETVARKSLLGE